MSTNSVQLQVERGHRFSYIPAPEPDIKQSVKNALPKLGKGSIEELRSEIKGYYLKRFRRPKTPKYGSTSKAFTEQQLSVFLRQIPNQKHRLLFSFMANLGLRIGEAVKVNIKDIDFETRELRIRTEKARQLDSCLSPSRCSGRR
jgi:integrase